jgi:hypothetical protein
MEADCGREGSTRKNSRSSVRAPEPRLIAICSWIRAGGKACSEPDEEITFEDRREEVSRGPSRGLDFILLRMHFFS